MTVKCAKCGEVLNVSTDEDPQERQPCPYCGAKVRDVEINIEAGVMAIAAVGTVSFVVSKVGLVLQTVVIKGERTNEGQLIEAVALPWFDIIDRLKDDPNLAYTIPPRVWEEIVAGAYKKAGFEEVTLTPRSRDYGRDVIAVKRGLGIIRVIDQVKAYKPGHLVTADDVRALFGVLPGDGASKGFLTTTSDFAPGIKSDPLIAPFIPSQLELINGTKLMDRLQELAKKRN
jgi:restriction system protein